MSDTIISDKYGNRRKVSDRDSSINLVPNISEKKINISNRPSGADSVISVYSKGKVGKKIESKDVVLHNCIKGIGSCQEKEDGSLWFYIGTYKTRINFCPYCCYRAKGWVK